MNSHALPPDQLRRAMRYNMIAGSLGMPWLAVALGMPLILWLEWIGARGWQIGLIVTIQQLMVIFQIPSAMLAERMVRHKNVWATLAIPHRLLWLVPAILSLTLAQDHPQAAIYIMMGCVAVSGALGAAPTPLWFCWMGRLIPPEISGQFWGKRQAICMAMFMIAILIIGITLNHGESRNPALAFAWVFAIVSLLGVIDIIVHYFGVPEPPNTDIPVRKLSLRERLTILFAQRNYMRFCFGMGVTMFAVGLSGSFIPVYLKRYYEFTYVHQSLMPVFGSIGAILAGLTLGRMIDRVGSRAVLLALVFAGPLSGTGWIFMTSDMAVVGSFSIPKALFVASGVHVIGGFLYGGIGVCQLQMVHGLTPPGQRLFGTAFFWVMIGLIAALGPLAGGSIVDFFDEHPLTLTLPTGDPVAFFHVLVLLHALVIWLIAFPLLRGLRLSDGEQQLRHHIMSIIPGNAFRAVVNTVAGPISSSPDAESPPES